MTKSKILLYLCLLFIAGVFVYSFIKAPQENEELYQYYDQEITLKGVIIDEPEKRINQIKFQFKAEEIPGKILVTTELYPEYHYGDELEISGKIREPAQFEDFDYRQYLAKDKIYSVIYWPAINRLAENQGNWFFQKVFNFKDKLRKVIEQTLLPPQSSVLKAIFLGDRFGLSNELKEKLNITGTRHIVAISGMHMIIMSQILLFLALGLGLWRGQAFYFVLFFLVLYIIMIGAPASAVRAGIMAGLLLLAQKIGRLRSADRAVVLAATTMLAINPSLLKADVGFQLSFMAVLSIIYLKPILDNKTISWPNPWRLKDILTMTLAAQLGTLPILIFHFGRLSLISPLANLLIVPLLPLIMISGITLSFAGLIWLSLAKILAWPVWFLLSYTVKVVDYLSSFPLAAYEFKNISWLILIGYYLILVLIIYKCSRPKKLITQS
ncbi:MAG: ComEC family competence protein [Candidatus Portnoybacteria bacterium]|nr:ComEC family competence protein [Candidatus Portnoybacteria bacterium]